LDYYEDKSQKTNEEQEGLRESDECKPNEGSPIKYIHDAHGKDKKDLPLEEVQKQTDK